MALSARCIAQETDDVPFNENVPAGDGNGIASVAAAAERVSHIFVVRNLLQAVEALAIHERQTFNPDKWNIDNQSAAAVGECRGLAGLRGNHQMLAGDASMIVLDPNFSFRVSAAAHENDIPIFCPARSKGDGCPRRVDRAGAGVISRGGNIKDAAYTGDRILSSMLQNRMMKPAFS